MDGEVALEPEGSGLRGLPFGSEVFWDAWRVWDDELALRVDVNEASALGGRGEVACTRARAAGVATIESTAALSADRVEEVKLASMRRCSSVRFEKWYLMVTILLEAEGPAAGASVSANLRFLLILADLTLFIGRAGSGIGGPATDGAAEESCTTGRFSTAMLSPRSSSGTRHGVAPKGADGVGRGLGTTVTG